MNSQSNPTQMTRERFQQLLDAYGAEPKRWPKQERQVALMFLETSPKARQQLEEANWLDRSLDQLTPHSPSPELMAVVIQSAQSSNQKSRAENIWPFASFWQPIGALACSALLGVALGSQTLWPVSSQEERANLLENEVIQLAYGMDWDEESDG